MNWKLVNDNTEPVFTAQKHILSSHKHSDIQQLPETCMLFEMGSAISYIEELFSTYTIADRIPGFISDGKCIGIQGHENICFVKGGFGAPAAVDTLETLLALGVKRFIILGMSGGFSEKIEVGDIVIPSKIYCEDGTSQHYLGNVEKVNPDPLLREILVNCFSSEFSVLEDPTVSTDAIYRQTLAKEAQWREKDCVAVDMETSALLAVCKFYEIPAAVALICSDKHPIPGVEAPWSWGNQSFKEKRKAFVKQIVSFVLDQFS